MSWGVLPWVYPAWDSLGCLNLSGYFLPHFREVFNYYLLNYFLMAFLFVFFWDSYDSHVGAFNIVSEVSEVVFISFNSFFSLLHLFSTFYLPLHLFYLLPQVFHCWFPPNCFWDQLLHYLLLIDFFISSRSLLNISCIFSILSPGYLSVPPFCFQDFGSFFWILFQIDSLSPPLFLVWWASIIFLYLLNISLPFHLV